MSQILNRYNCGDTIYFYYKIIDTVSKGTILGYNYEPAINNYVYKIALESGGTLICIEDELFMSYEECLRFVNEESDHMINAYLSSIKTKDDLIRFCFNHNIYKGEHCEIPARYAAITKATEFGISIKEEE